MESYYVLHDYQDNFSLSEELKSISDNENFDIVMHNPKLDDILSFIGVDETEYIDDRFVFVSQPNSFDVHPFYEIVKYESKNFKPVKDGRQAQSCILYDTKLCCLVDFGNKKEGIFNSISPANRYDIEKYDCFNARQSDSWLNDGTYFLKTKEILRKYILDNNLEEMYPLETFNIQQVKYEQPELHLHKGKLIVLKTKQSPKNRLIKLIKKDYVEIYESCLSENFFDSLASKYDAIKEVKVGEKVVGLLFGIITKSFFGEDFYIETFYVLPEYNDDFQISYELREIEERYKYHAYIHNPKHADIELLLEEGTAHYIDKRFVYIEHPLIFEVMPFEDSLNMIITSYEDIDSSLETAPSLFYDMDLCCAINFASEFDESEWNPEYLKQLSEEGFSDEVERDIISVANQVDVENYDCINKRRNDSWIKDGIYFEKTKKIFRQYLTNNDVYCKYPLDELNILD